MEIKNLKDIVKIWVNARGITNGELDVNGIEYLEGSDLDKLIQFIRNNNFNDDVILNEILKKLNDYGDNITFRLEGLGRIINQIILQVIQNELLIRNTQITLDDLVKIITSSVDRTEVSFIEINNRLNKIQNDLIEIKDNIKVKSKLITDNIDIVKLDIQKIDTKTDAINTNIVDVKSGINNIDFEADKITNKIDGGVVDINKIVSKQGSDINRTLKQLIDKVEPKVIVKKEIEKQTHYIEVETTKYIYVDKKEDVKPTTSRRIDRGPIQPKNYEVKDTSWKPFYGDWLIKQNNGCYFKLSNQSDSQMLRLDDFVNKYGKGDIGIKLLELGLISQQKATQTGSIYTSASKNTPQGADPTKWKWSNSSW
jgi:hypothetical protein